MAKFPFVLCSFWAVGYAFAYGGDDPTKGKTFIGNEGFFLASGDIEFHNWFFQFAFACALSSIVAGTIAERTQMVRILVFKFLYLYSVYSLIYHTHLNLYFLHSVGLPILFYLPRWLLLPSGGALILEC